MLFVKRRATPAPDHCVCGSGELLFTQFVCALLEELYHESRRAVLRGGIETFSQELRDTYINLAKKGQAASREMLERDFPAECDALVVFAENIGIEDRSCVWSRQLVAEFWRGNEGPFKIGSRVEEAIVHSHMYPRNVVYIQIIDGGMTYVSNPLDLPLEQGHRVSVYRQVICEIREA